MDNDWLKELTPEQREQIASENGVRDIAEQLLQMDMNRRLFWRVVIHHQYGIAETHVETEPGTVRPDRVAENNAINQFCAAWWEHFPNTEAPTILFCEIMRKG